MAKVISHVELIGLLSYDLESGLFSWRKTRQGARNGLRAGRINSRGYAQVCINYKHYSAHRLAWFYVHGEWPMNDLDHINGVRSDNRIANLRLATELENSRNRKCPANNAEGLKGVYKSSANKWRAQIKVKGQRIVLGHFFDKYEAHAAYAQAASKYFGQFANPGQP